MFIFRLTLICVLLNTAFAQSDHQLMHLSSNHPVEQCDACAQSNTLDDFSLTTASLVAAKFRHLNVTKPDTFQFNKNTVQTLHARGPPKTFAFLSQFNSV